METNQVDEWISKMWYIIRTLEYSFCHKKEWSTWYMLQHGWTFEILYKMKGTSHKRAYTLNCMISFMWNVQIRRVHRDRKKIGSCQGLGMFGKNRYKWVQDYFLEWWKYSGIVLIVAQLVNILKTTHLCTLKGCILCVCELLGWCKSYCGFCNYF